MQFEVCVCVCMSINASKYFSACRCTKDTIIHSVTYYILHTVMCMRECVCVWPAVSPSFFPLFLSLWSTATCRFCSFLPVCVFYARLWWSGRKLAAQWCDSGNVRNDWNQRRLRDRSICSLKISPAKQLAPSLGLHSPPADRHVHTGADALHSVRNVHVVVSLLDINKLLWIILLKQNTCTCVMWLDPATYSRLRNRKS